jgi:sulfonate transport system substrate-binding protein
VKLVFLQPADALTAFISGQADAWAIWDPYTAQAEQQVPVRSVAQATGVTNGAGFGIASDAALADPKRNTALGDLLVRYAKATRWAQDHPDEWARSYGTAVGLALPVATVAQGRSLRSSTPLSDELIDSEQKLADLFAETKQIASAPTFADWVDHRYDDTLESSTTNGN